MWSSKSLIYCAGIATLTGLLLISPLARPAPLYIHAQPTANEESAGLTERVRRELATVAGRFTHLDVRITIGAAAFRDALAQKNTTPLVAVYLTSTEFEAALEGRERPPYVTAVFSNPDPLDQVALARALLGRPTVGVFDSPETHSLVTRIKDRDVRVIPVSPRQGIDSLLRAADLLDVILVLPESTVLNRSNINHVVRTLYQRRKVLVGYSATLTQIGSLASVYVTPEEAARTVAEVLEQYSKTGALPKPGFVRHVAVAVNDRLARSLNIALPDRAKLLEAVRSTKEEEKVSP